MINITYIYLIENIDNDPYKIYIGKSKNPYHRKSIHKQTYGSQILYTIIDQVDTLDRNYWKPIETMWIQTFISWGYNVVNTRKEGGSGCSSWTKSQREKHSQLFSGRNITWNTKGSKGYKWTEEQKDNRRGKGTGCNIKITQAKINHPSRSKPVLQYTLNNIFIQEWPSCSEAGRILFNNKSQCIQDCASGRQNTGYGYIWKYKTHTSEETITNYIHNHTIFK